MPWDEVTLTTFREALRLFMLEHELTPQGLEGQLGYRSGGYLVRTYLGEVRRPLPPSQRFLERLERIGFSFSPNGNEPSGAPQASVHHLPAGVVAVVELPVGTVIAGQPRQCPECVAEAVEGKRHPARTWYVFGHPNQRYCSPKHRRAWYRRQKMVGGKKEPASERRGACSL
jgi:hypothetical protein